MLSLLLLLLAATLSVSTAAATATAAGAVVLQGDGYQALAGPCQGGQQMTITNATSLADCQSQCTKQRDSFNGCTAALEKLCGSVFRACPTFPCSTCESCTTTHKAALTSAGCATAEAGCAPYWRTVGSAVVLQKAGCAGLLTQYCVKPPTHGAANAKAAPACMGVDSEANASHAVKPIQRACHFRSACTGVVDPAGKCEAVNAKGGKLCGYRSMAPPPAPPPMADPFARCGFDEAGIEGTGGELNLPFGTNPFCCGNTTWSSFSWRAKASPNVPFSATAVAAGTAAEDSIGYRPHTVPNSTECAKLGASPLTFNCFSFCFNTSNGGACRPPKGPTGPVPASCQAAMNAVCNAPANSACANATVKASGESALPLVGLYDGGMYNASGVLKPTTRMWRCYGQNALDPTHKHWNNVSSIPIQCGQSNTALRDSLAAAFASTSACEAVVPGSVAYPAGEWSRWNEFNPQAPWRATPTSAVSTVAASYCNKYPNPYRDPIAHLLVALDIGGVFKGNMSTVTLEVKPTGAKAGQPTYQINATVSQIMGGVRAPALTGNIQLSFMVTRENLTSAEGGGPPLVTERAKLQPLWAALPKIKKTPRKIMVAQEFHGHVDVGSWVDAATSLVQFGASAVTGAASTDMAKVFESTGVSAAVLRGGLSPNYEMEYRSPIYNFSTECAGASSDTDHCWGRTDAEVAENLRMWADSLVQPMRAAGYPKLTQFSMHDELGFGFPGLWTGKNNISHNPRVFRRYHQYLQNMSGLTTPHDFGASSWDEVVPITRINITAGAANEKQLLVRFYWTIRFAVWDQESWYAQATAALVKANAGEPFTIYTNWNNFHGRLYTPGGKWNLNCSGSGKLHPVSCETDHGAPDWFEAGRLRAGTMLWSESWFGDSKASEWTYLAARLRGAAKLGGPDMQFGGYITPRGPTGGVAHGTVGLLKQAIAMVGSGAKGLNWFSFGPEDLFPGNCYTAIGMHEANHSTFTFIAEASRMIAEVEDLLIDGAMPTSTLAVLYPRSSFLWDEASGGVYGPIGPHGTEDPGATAMDYMAVLAGLFRGIQQVFDIQVDFIDEDSLNAEDLAPFKALILTEPDVPAEGLSAVKSWVAAGGHLMTVTGAGANDRYNTPSTVLREVTGVQEAARPRQMIGIADNLLLVANGTGDLGPIAAFGSRPPPQGHGPGLGNVTAFDPSVKVLAQFSDGSPAILRNSHGAGSATHFTYMPCIHFNEINPFRPVPHYNNMTNYTDGSLPYIMRFIDNAGVAPRVKVSVLQVETPLIVSADGAGAVLSLLNWRESVVTGLEVSVRLGFQVGRVTGVRAMHPVNDELHFTSTPAAGGGEFVTNFTVAMLEHSDFVMLHKK